MPPSRTIRRRPRGLTAMNLAAVTFATSFLFFCHAGLHLHLTTGNSNTNALELEALVVSDLHVVGDAIPELHRDDRPTAYERVPPPNVSPLVKEEIRMHGVTFTYNVRNPNHKVYIRGHLERETNGYALLKDAISHARRRHPEEKRPLVIDVGANHGTYSLFAAALDADVIALEPQVDLCRVIQQAVQLSGLEERVRVYHNAVLDEREVVSLGNTKLGEGGVAYVVRNKEDTGEGGVGRSETNEVKARHLDDFIPISEKRDVSFLKVDVEGFELRAIPSLERILHDAGRVRNVLVEFGPPGRWEVASQGVEDGIQFISRMKHEWGFVPRLVRSQVWNKYLEGSTMVDAEEYAATKRGYILLDDEKAWEYLMHIMLTCKCEAYLWFTKDVDETWETFEGPCGREANGRDAGNGKWAYGC